MISQFLNALSILIVRLAFPARFAGENTRPFRRMLLIDQQVPGLGNSTFRYWSNATHA